MTAHRSPWAPEDEEALRNLWHADAEIDEMVTTLGRKRSTIFARAAALGLPRRRASNPWTRTELDTLAKLVERRLSDAEIAAKLGDRSAEAVTQVRRKMGLTRPKEPMAQRPMQVVGPASVCQWIAADPKKGPAPICGKPSVDGKSYCARHARLAYQQRCIDGE